MGTLAELFKRGVTQIVALGGTTTGSGEAAGLMVVANDGNAGQSHNRHLSIVGNALATDVATATWKADEKVTSFRVKATAVTSSNLVRFVLDASPVDDAIDKTQAIAWLTPVAAAVNHLTDVEYFEVRSGAGLTGEVDPVGVNEWSEWYELGGFLRRLDAIAIDVDEQVNLFIEVA